MIQLKNMLMEGPSDPDEKLNRVAKHFFGPEYTLVNRRPNPQNPREIIFTFSDGKINKYIAKTPDADTFIWYIRKNDTWEKILDKSIPRRQYSPEELTAQDERRRIRQKKEAAFLAKMDAERRAEEQKRREKLSKLPNWKTDWDSDSTGNNDFDHIIKSFLPPREQKLVFMKYKGYTDQDISWIIQLSPQRIRTIYKRAMAKLQKAKPS